VTERLVGDNGKLYANPVTHALGWQTIMN
jgi:hypothetical protein